MREFEGCKCVEFCACPGRDFASHERIIFVLFKLKSHNERVGETQKNSEHLRMRRMQYSGV